MRPRRDRDEVLERLGQNLEGGTKALAASEGVEHAVLLGELVERARRSPPAILPRRDRRWGAPDAAVGIGLLLLLALAGHAVWILRTPPSEPEVDPVAWYVGEGAAGGDTELAGRTLLALPVTPASYALLGELPTRLSAAVVPGPPAAGAAARPVHRLDDLLVLRAESAGGGLAVLAAVPEAELPALLEALPGATVHLLRPPPVEGVATRPAPTAPERAGGGAPAAGGDGASDPGATAVPPS